MDVSKVTDKDLMLSLANRHSPSHDYERPVGAKFTCEEKFSGTSIDGETALPLFLYRQSLHSQNGLGGSSEQ